MAAMANQPNVPQGWTRIPWVMGRFGPESPYEITEQKDNPMFQIGDILRTPGPGEVTIQIVDAHYGIWKWYYLVVSPGAQNPSWRTEESLNMFTFMRDWNPAMTSFLNPVNLVPDISRQAPFPQYPENYTFDVVTNLGTSNAKIKTARIRRSSFFPIGGIRGDPRMELRQYWIEYAPWGSLYTESFDHYRLMWLRDETERFKAGKKRKIV